MDILDRAYRWEFESKTGAEAFIKRMRDMAYKIDVITLNDIFKDRMEGITPEGFQYGYSKKDIRKLKAEKAGTRWEVRFPKPGKMVRDTHGYWTTEIDILRNPDPGGGI